MAVDPRTGNLYVADLANYRVQEFTATGLFVSMFGGDVNATFDRRRGVTAQQRDICTAALGDRCQAGTLGSAIGQLSYPVSVAVDHDGHDVYVLEKGPRDSRLDKYTANGSFVWMIGRGVNRSSGGNLCTEREVARERVSCGAGAENAADSLEPGALNPTGQSGDLIAVGGPEHLVYVGDEHRVQEFAADGGWKREILLATASATPLSAVSSLAVAESGAIYLVYKTGIPSGEHDDLVRRFDARGEQVGQFLVLPRLAGAEPHIDGIALGPDGRLVVIGVEVGAGFYKRFGFVYDGGSGRLVGEFPPPPDNDGLTVDGSGDLYVAATDDQEVVAYVPAPGVELASSPVPCTVATIDEWARLFDCVLDTGQSAQAL